MRRFTFRDNVADLRVVQHVTGQSSVRERQFGSGSGESNCVPSVFSERFDAISTDEPACTRDQNSIGHGRLDLFDDFDFRNGGDEPDTLAA